jgi:thioredoxin reductase (NADPH)
MVEEQIRVYGAPWCPDCRRAKKFLGQQRVPYEWIDLDQNPDATSLVRKMNGGKQTIPTIVFPDGSFLAEPSNDEIASKLGLRLKAKRNFYDLVIVGGGPTGLAASIYAAREGIDCLLVDKGGLGGQAATTERIENYPGFPEGIGGAELADRIVTQAQRYGVELLSAVSVSEIGREEWDLCVRTEQGDEYGAHAVLIATGSTYRRLGVPGEEELIGAGIHFCATCDGPFYRDAEEVLVVGGGNSGLQEAVFLSRFAKKVRIIEYEPKLRASQVLQEKVLSHPQFDVHTNTEVTEFQGGAKLTGVAVKDRQTGEESVYHPAAAFVFIGLQPNTAFLKGAFNLDRWGFIVTDDTLQTSVPGVFAAGDVRAGSTKQLASAVGEGASALLMVRQYLERHSHLARHQVND